MIFPAVAQKDVPLAGVNVPVGRPFQTVKDCVVTVLLPQALLAVTVTFPVPADTKLLTIIEGLPFPVKVPNIAGTVQV